VKTRAAAAWMIKYGIPGWGLRQASRSGEPIARLAADPHLRENPFPAYEQLRAGGPLMTGRFVYGTASYAIANELLRSDKFLAGPAAPVGPGMRWLLKRTTSPETAHPVDPPSLLAINGSDHMRMRKLAAHAFTPRATAALAARVDDIAYQLLDEIAAGNPDRFDLVTRYASRLPVTVITEILGVPEAARTDFVRWADDAAMSLEPALGWHDFRRVDAAVCKAHVWLAGHITELRRNPGDDLLSKMIQAVDGSDRLSDIELRNLALLLLGAGFETTVNLIGNAIPLLLSHPDQLERLKAEPDGWPNAVEEVLRYDSPVQMTVRIAKDETEVAGTYIRKGAQVVIMIGGANRDPDRFTDPNLFDTTRENAREHLAFSAGAHYCLGAQLARLEGATALRALFERFPGLALDGVPTRNRTRVLRGYEHLPVRVGAPDDHGDRAVDQTLVR
jgi:cytochrome P450